MFEFVLFWLVVVVILGCWCSCCYLGWDINIWVFVGVFVVVNYLFVVIVLNCFAEVINKS